MKAYQQRGMGKIVTDQNTPDQRTSSPVKSGAQLVFAFGGKCGYRFLGDAQGDWACPRSKSKRSDFAIKLHAQERMACLHLIECRTQNAVGKLT